MSRDYHFPVRPPRGTKVTKDTSGKLMNIIAELSVSKNNEDRKRKKQQLEKDFRSSDARVGYLVAGNRDHLSNIMETYSRISAIVTTNRNKCRDVKEKLIACKKLLECKRDEIRRLWLEAVEHREVISMLQEIEDLKKVPAKVQQHLKEENFFQATELLVSSISLLDKNLVGVDALKDLKSELHVLRENLHNVLIQEIHTHLYMSPSDVFLKRSSEDGKVKTYEEIFNNPCLSSALPIAESYDCSEDSKYHHIAAILQCVYMLNRLPETVDILKERCQRELMGIVKNSSQLMYDTLKHTSYASEQPLLLESQNQEHQRFLLDLLEAILNQFRHVAFNHKMFLVNLQKIKETKEIGDISYYEMADIYCKLQATVEMFIGDYLDLSLHNAAASQRTATTFAKVPTVTDISSYFLKKGPVRTKKLILFEFEGSSHAMSMKSYLQEQKDSLSLKVKGEMDSIDGDQSFLICQPTAKNITLIYKALKEFISEIECALHMESGAHCPLHTFLVDCVKVYLDQVNMEVNRLIERTSSSLGTWQPVSDTNELKAAKAKSLILNSTLTLNNNLRELEKLIFSLPDYSNQILQLICNILLTYKDLCFAAYKSLISSHAEDQRIFSVSWARDQDISRLLRSLPNWTNLQVKESLDSTHDFEESPEEIRFRNKEESDLLIRNLSCKDSISLCEILSDPNQLHSLALMHESMEWISSEIVNFAESLPDIPAVAPSSLPEKVHEDAEGIVNTESSAGMTTKGYLKKLAKDYEDLADTCLLVLHLEVRAHCFYFLLPLSKQETCINRKDDQEPEPEVVKLNSDLSKTDEALSPVLQPKKVKYIFEGLGELISTILINSVANIKKINENGVKKMGRNIFAIQQNLAGITMTREVALDRARQYFELLNHSFEDILNQIVEAGPQFQENEYSAVIQLLYNGREGFYDDEQEPLSNYLEKLRQILDEVAVSV